MQKQELMVKFFLGPNNTALMLTAVENQGYTAL